MNNDRRGFSYRLAPLRLQATWRLDALLLELAGSSRRLEELRHEIDALKAHRAASSQAATPVGAEPFDPAAAHRRLAYLADVHRRLSMLEAQQQAAEADHATRRSKAHDAQLRLEALEKDEARSLQHHLSEQAQRQAIAADDDWAARADWRRSQSLPEGGRP